MGPRSASLPVSVDLAQGDVTSSACFGDIYREILAQAEISSVDLIIIGSNKPQATDFLLGTNAAAWCAIHPVRCLSFASICTV